MKLLYLESNGKKNSGRQQGQGWTQPACDVPGTSPEGPLKVLTSGTSGDLQGTLSGPTKKLII